MAAPSVGFDAVLVGGRAPKYLRHNAQVLDLIRAFAAQGKWLFAICPGIQGFNSAGVVAGRKVTCYEHVRSEVLQAGEEWQAAQTWESHPEFYREVMGCLKG